jgi:hypothetical protein
MDQVAVWAPWMEERSLELFALVHKVVFDGRMIVLLMDPRSLAVYCWIPLDLYSVPYPGPQSVLLTHPHLLVMLEMLEMVIHR